MKKCLVSIALLASAPFLALTTANASGPEKPEPKKKTVMKSTAKVSGTRASETANKGSSAGATAGAATEITLAPLTTDSGRKLTPRAVGSASLGMAQNSDGKSSPLRVGSASVLATMDLGQREDATSVKKVSFRPAVGAQASADAAIVQRPVLLGGVVAASPRGQASLLLSPASKIEDRVNGLPATQAYLVSAGGSHQFGKGKNANGFKLSADVSYGRLTNVGARPMLAHTTKTILYADGSCPDGTSTVLSSTRSKTHFSTTTSTSYPANAAFTIIDNVSVDLDQTGRDGTGSIFRAGMNASSPLGERLSAYCGISLTKVSARVTETYLDGSTESSNVGNVQMAAEAGVSYRLGGKKASRSNAAR